MRVFKGLLTRKVNILAGLVMLGVLVMVNKRPAPQDTAAPRDTNSEKSVSPDSSSQCRALFTIPKEKDSNRIWDPEDPYERLSEQLPTLLKLKEDGSNSSSSSSSSSSSFIAFPGTRLHLMEGSVPYIPCKVQKYGLMDVSRCVAARASKGASTWITFVGDSNQRQKIHSILDFLPSDLTFTFYLGKWEASRHVFTQSVKFHKMRPQTFDIIGRRFTPSNPKRKERKPQETSTGSNPSGNMDTSISDTSSNPKISRNHPTEPYLETENGPQNVSVMLETKQNESDNADALDTRHKPLNLSTTPTYDPVNKSHTSSTSSSSSINSKSLEDLKPSLKYDTNTPINIYPIHEDVEEKEDNEFVLLDSRFHEPLLESDLKGVTYDLRITLVWAPCGSWITHPLEISKNITKKKVVKLHDLAEAEVVPDVVVVGYGKWFPLMREFDDELSTFSEMDVLTRPIMEPLTTLAFRTHLIFWKQTRFRDFNFYNDGLPSNLKWQEELEKNWNKLLYFYQFYDVVPLLDRWLWRIIRKTGAWLWDSAMPFNLANIKECKKLRDSGHYLTTNYQYRWWNCRDPHHAAYETNSVEIEMLLNLLCNSPLGSPSQYCCSS